MYNLSALFTRDAIISNLKSLPPVHTTIIDEIFTDRPNLGSPIVGSDMVSAVVRELPVVLRGAPSVPATTESGAISFFEPLPIRPNKMVTGADLNNLKVLGRGGQQAWAREKTDYLRKACRKTAEAMGAMALSGRIQWPVAMESGSFESWDVNFGSPLTFTCNTLISASTAKIKDVFAILTGMAELIEEQGFGGELVTYAGKLAFSNLVGLAENVTTTAKVKVSITENVIDVGGYKVKRMAERYRNPSSGNMTAKVGDHQFVMVAKDGGHKMPYCAIDDLDGNLQAMPFFIKPITLKDPSGVKLVAESKPFPIVNTSAICSATVSEA
ncbi:MAG: major capsid protein [Kiritimatiellia bacterium]